MARPSGRRGVSRDYPDAARGRGDAGYGGRRAPYRQSGDPGYAHGGVAARSRGQRAVAQHGRVSRPGAGGRSGYVDPPRAGRTGFTRGIPSWRLVGTLVLAGAAFVVLAFFLAYATTPIPDGKVSATYQTSTVYYRDGSTLGRFQQENRTNVTIDKIPQHLRYAVYSAEDRTFESNSGISVTGMVRALLNNAQGGSLQGGSTITQQYVKNYYLNPDRTYKRKVRELFIALKVGRTQSKDEILTGYLNTIYFGRSANGVEAAARAYFGKNVEKLTPSESAYLAGIIKGPELYDPRDGKEATARAKERWQFVVDGMVSEGWLTAEQAASMTFPKTVKYRPSTTPKGYAGYLLQMVRKEALANGFTATELDTAGFDIYTTVDKKLMDAAAESVEDVMPDRSKWPSGLQVGLTSIDVASGEVRAIYGGQDYLERQRNAATQDVAQAGSTFKPFTLLAALQGKRSAPTGECRPTITDSSIGLDSRFDGHSPRRVVGFRRPVRNFGNEQFGQIDLRRATAHSVNTVFAQLNVDIGPRQTMNAAVCAGIPKDAVGLDDNPANVLGTASVHPIDMASAYATIAANGRHTPPHVLVKIVRHQTKKTVYAATAERRQVFDRDVTANAISAMEQVVTGGTGGYASRLDRPVAGKTGTSSDSMSAWFVGFTPQVSTSVAMYRVGEDGGQVEIGRVGRYSEVTGGSYPVRIWTDYMSTAVKGQPVTDFPDAEPIGEDVNPAPSTVPAPQTTTRTSTPTPTATTTVTREPTKTPKGSPTATDNPTDTPTATRTRTRTRNPTATLAATTASP